MEITVSDVFIIVTSVTGFIAVITGSILACAKLYRMYKGVGNLSSSR